MLPGLARMHFDVAFLGMKGYFGPEAEVQPPPKRSFNHTSAAREQPSFWLAIAIIEIGNELVVAIEVVSNSFDMV